MFIKKIRRKVHRRFRGRIDRYSDGVITGWFYSPRAPCELMLVVNDVFVCTSFSYFYRDDVSREIRQYGRFGFRAIAPFVALGKFSVQLFCLYKESEFLIDEKELVVDCVALSLFHSQHMIGQLGFFIRKEKLSGKYSRLKVRFIHECVQRSDPCVAKEASLLKGDSLKEVLLLEGSICSSDVTPLLNENDSSIDKACCIGFEAFIRMLEIDAKAVTCLIGCFDVVVPPQKTLGLKNSCAHAGLPVTLQADNSNCSIFQVGDESDLIVAKKSILIIWKSIDASIYGRRVDVIARSLAACGDYEKVNVLEFCSNEEWVNLKNKVGESGSEAKIVLERIRAKLNGLVYSNVDYHVIKYWDPYDLCDQFQRFLCRHRIYPHTSKVILFPIIPQIDVLMGFLVGFEVHVDVVDDQIYWANGHAKKTSMLLQYNAMFRISKSIVFNSDANLQTFSKRKAVGLYLADKSRFIPNWYAPPKQWNYDQRLRLKDRIVYASNLNDRVDWSLLSKIASYGLAKWRLCIIGSSIRVIDKLESLVKFGNVDYLGVLDEERCLAEISYSRVAILPHLNNDLSKSMNPMKVMMYRSVGVPVVCTSVNGVASESEGVWMAQDHMEFINYLDMLFDDDHRKHTKATQQKKCVLDYIGNLQ